MMLQKIRISSRVSFRVAPVSSMNSAFSSSVIRSSEGFLTRQSTYSSKPSPMKEWPVRSIGLPASVRSFASASSWTSFRCSSGMPSSMPMTRMGMSAPRSEMKLNWPPATRGSSALAQYARICGSNAFIFFGVKTRVSRLRWMPCSGGSSKMNTPGGTGAFALMNSRMPPRPEMKVSRSIRPRSTSSYRLTA